MTSGLFGQDNPMFDSLDYFTRNKIMNIHYLISSWYYSPGWDYMKFSFNKKTSTLNCDSIHYIDPSSPMAKTTTLGSRRLNLKDTVYHRPGFAYSTTIKYQFDLNGRLTKMLDITEYYNPSAVDGLLPSDKTFTTTTEYFYADDVSKKLVRTTTDFHSFLEERNFFYKNNRLIKRVDKQINKNDKKVSVDTHLYKYYADGKLRKETRQVKDGRCKSNCIGTIEYKYDVE